jgi:hypothetical protein
MPNVSVTHTFRSSHDMTYRELVELAIEALQRSNMYCDTGHPEDLASHLVPAIEAVAIGYGAGLERKK